MSAPGRKLKFALRYSVAGLYGNRIDAFPYRCGHQLSGRQVHCIRCVDVDEPVYEPDELVSPEAARKMIEDIITQYEGAGQLAEKQSRTLRAVWRDRESIRSIARREGVSPQAILARIEGTRRPGGRTLGGLVRKIPEFAADWPVIKSLQHFR